MQLCSQTGRALANNPIISSNTRITSLCHVRCRHTVTVKSSYIACCYPLQILAMLGNNTSEVFRLPFTTTEVTHYLQENIGVIFKINNAGFPGY